MTIQRFVVGIVLLASPLWAAYDLPLTTGWNLVSIPEQQSNPSIEVVTRSLQGKFAAIWSYENGQWSGYFPGQAASTLSRMDAGRAYWIFMNQPGSLVGAGMRPASAVTLPAGWNFVGFNAPASRPAAEVFGGNPAAIETARSPTRARRRSTRRSSRARPPATTR